MFSHDDVAAAVGVDGVPVDVAAGVTLDGAIPLLADGGVNPASVKVDPGKANVGAGIDPCELVRLPSNVPSGENVAN